MKQFIDKLISRLEEARKTALDKVKLPIPMPIILSKRSLQELVDMCFEESIRLANEVAEEYKGGWVPCSERLPEVNQKVFVAFKVAHRCEKTIDYDIGCLSSYDGKWYCDHKGYDVEKVLAWMPLPSPYHPEK